MRVRSRLGVRRDSRICLIELRESRIVIPVLRISAGHIVGLVATLTVSALVWWMSPLFAESGTVDLREHGGRQRSIGLE